MYKAYGNKTRNSAEAFKIELDSVKTIMQSRNS